MQTILRSFCCATLLIATTLTAEQAPRVTGSTILTSKLLKTIDGKSFGIDGKKIRAILIIRTHLLHILHGVLKNGARVGLYHFNGTDYTVKQLHEIERSNLFERSLLLSWLKTAKQDFATKITPFLELARGSKPQMLILIEESLSLHKRKNSILHMWAQEPEGDDMVGFDREVQCFDDLYIFLNDLLNFLDDLIASSPKACTQFLDSLPNEQERKSYAQRFHDVFERQKQKINKG